MTLPPRPEAQGTIHPVSQVMDEITAIFADLGFSVAEGPQVESDWYNFDALNIPPEHPARQEHDTFYMARAGGDNRPPHVLRTHTSPVQIRHMETHGVPCRVIAPGRVYRADYDQTHTPMFHQVEGLAIDRDISMANLKWVLEEFCRAFFEVDGVELKFRASHFPFTEPSAEVDIRCSFAGGQLRIGEGDDWLEILGSGMVHPKVLAAAGVDPNEWQGFAFGMGIDRLAMLKYGIPDLRAFFESDLRWLRHYGFVAARRADAPGRDQPVTPAARGQPARRTSSTVSRRSSPSRVSQPIDAPALRPISAAPIGVSTDTRPLAMSASAGSTTLTVCSRPVTSSRKLTCEPMLTTSPGISSDGSTVARATSRISRSPSSAAGPRIAVAASASSRSL